MNIYSLFTRMSVFLTSGGLFDENYTQGQLGLIEGFKDNAGTVVCWVVSIVGFAIVAAAIIKNALAGLYLAFPKLWDKVHDYRKSLEDSMGGGSGGSGVKKHLGSIAIILFSLLPDVKDQTEFADDEAGGSAANNSMKKKEWFTKAIPQFLALVTVGMLIFYGYPSKLANWLGDAGLYLGDAFFDNVDPVQIVKKVTNGITTYTLITDDSTDPLEQSVNDITKDVMKSVYTRYSDMHKDYVQHAATEFESTFLSEFRGVAIVNDFLSNADGYSVSYTTQLLSGTPNFSDAYKKQDGADAMWIAQSTSGTYSVKLVVNMSDVNTGSTKVGATDYVLVTVNAVPSALSVVSSANIAIGLPAADFNSLIKGNKNNAYHFELQHNCGNGATDTKITWGASVVVTAYDIDGNALGNGVKATIQNVTSSQNSNVKPYVVLAESAYKELTSILSTNGTKVAYIQIMAPKSTYHKVSVVSDTGVTTTTKVNVHSFRVYNNKCTDAIAPAANSETKFINLNWTDAYSGKVKFGKGNEDNFFTSKSSGELK